MAKHRTHTHWQHACQSQQRQILAMIGVETWVQRHAPTKPTLDLNTLDGIYFKHLKSNHFSQPNQSKNYIESVSNPISSQKKSQDLNGTTHLVYQKSEVFYNEVVQSDVIQNDISQNNFDEDSFNKNTVAKNDPTQNDGVKHDVIEHNIKQLSATKNINQSENSQCINRQVYTQTEKPMAFQLQGFCIGNRIFLIDVAKLDTNCQILWQNLTHSLSITVEQLTFPFCQEMNGQEMANASLTGFLFKLSRNEHIMVAMLTELPKGLDLTQQKIQSIPTLKEMLINPQQKKQFWQLLQTN